MRKKPFIPAKGVSNIELFYDLIFVYCISVLTSLCHHFEGDFLDLQTWSVYTFSFLVILQVWFYTTFLLNRYGDQSAADNICLFINMFLLYFLASGIQRDWASSIFTFNLAWALILLNLIVHWIIKRLRYDNLDRDDTLIMEGIAAVLSVQCIIALIAAFLPADLSAGASWVALILGTGVFGFARIFRRKDARFSHLTERCSLLVIVAFGETIVAVAIYMTTESSLLYPIFVFALVVGLFLIYIYERDKMTDHHKKTDGTLYLTITGWVILVIGNLAVALEFMPEQEIAFVPKSAYLTACLVLYLLTSFVLGRFNKSEFKYSYQYIAGRLIACAAIVIVAIVTNFNPLINLVFDTVVIYGTLLHEWLLYHSRSRFIELGNALGMTFDEMQKQGYAPIARDGLRSTIRKAKNVEAIIDENASDAEE